MNMDNLKFGKNVKSEDVDVVVVRWEGREIGSLQKWHSHSGSLVADEWMFDELVVGKYRSMSNTNLGTNLNTAKANIRRMFKELMEAK